MVRIMIIWQHNLIDKIFHYSLFNLYILTQCIYMVLRRLDGRETPDQLKSTAFSIYCNKLTGTHPRSILSMAKGLSKIVKWVASSGHILSYLLSVDVISRYDMELHMTYASPDLKVQNNIVVVAVLYKLDWSSWCFPFYGEIPTIYEPGWTNRQMKFTIM